MNINELNNPLLKAEDEQQRLLNQEHKDDDKEEVHYNIEDKMRNGFITKVFGIILFQMFITSLLILPSVLSSTYQQFQHNHYYFVIVSLIAVIILAFSPLCCRVILQKVPHNYIYLCAFTICFGYSVSFITSFYSASTVLYATTLTLITVGTLTVYAAKTKTDITVMGGVLYVSFMLVVFGTILSWLFYIPFLETIVTVFSLILFSIYLVYDIQLLLGNKIIKFSEDDYILAAISIYLDIMNIFLELLRLIGILRGD